MNLKTLIKKYKKLGLKDSQLLYINADFGNIINDISFNKEDLLSLHYTAIKKIIGRNGTIVVPTATLNLCGTKKVFLPNITKSHQMGAFSEYVRKKKGSKRSLHPLWSVAANGKLANYLTSNIPQHAFGYNSVFHRLVNNNAYWLCIGVDPRKSISVIHHIELICGVPYRYTVPFKQKIKIGKKIISKEFYHFALKDRNIVRDKNIKIFKNFERKFKMRELKLEKGKLTLFPLTKFYRVTADLLSQKPYSWVR